MPENELIDFFISFLPESVDGWGAVILLACCVAAYALPAPRPDCHPAWKIGYRIICILGMGAGKLKSAGKIGRLFRRKK